MIRLYVVNKDMHDDIAGAMYRVAVEIRSKRREDDERFARSTAWIFVTKEVWEALKTGSEYPLTLDTNEIIPPPPPEPGASPEEEEEQAVEEPSTETLN